MNPRASIEAEQYLAMAWLGLGRIRSTAAAAAHARVQVLMPVSFYFRRAPNPGSFIDMGRSSGTAFASISASSYST